MSMAYNYTINLEIDNESTRRIIAVNSIYQQNGWEIISLSESEDKPKPYITVIRSNNLPQLRNLMNKVTKEGEFHVDILSPRNPDNSTDYTVSNVIATGSAISSLHELTNTIGDVGTRIENELHLTIAKKGKKKINTPTGLADNYFPIRATVISIRLSRMGDAGVCLDTIERNETRPKEGSRS